MATMTARKAASALASSLLSPPSGAVGPGAGDDLSPLVNKTAVKPRTAIHTALLRGPAPFTTTPTTRKPRTPAASTCRSASMPTRRPTEPDSSTCPGAAAAAELGSRWCSAHVWPGSDERALEPNLEFHAERLRPVVKTLGVHGIRFEIEFVGTPSLRAPHRYEFVDDLPGALDLGVRIAEPNVGLLMDTWHLHTSGGTLDDIRRLRGEQVVHAHVNDASPGVPIDELVDMERLL